MRPPVPRWRSRAAGHRPAHHVRLPRTTARHPERSPRRSNCADPWRTHAHCLPANQTPAHRLDPARHPKRRRSHATRPTRALRPGLSPASRFRRWTPNRSRRTCAARREKTPHRASSARRRSADEAPRSALGCERAGRRIGTRSAPRVRFPQHRQSADQDRAAKGQRRTAATGGRRTPHCPPAATHHRSGGTRECAPRRFPPGTRRRSALPAGSAADQPPTQTAPPRTLAERAAARPRGAPPPRVHAPPNAMQTATAGHRT